MIANNLASLIASNRADAASLERAFAIARRLRGTGVPQFQDTYGWILHRRGDSEQALAILAPAAAALPGNALVQFHLAETELALDRCARGAGELRAGARRRRGRSPLPQAAEARAASPRSTPAPAGTRGCRRRLTAETGLRRLIPRSRDEEPKHSTGAIKSRLVRLPGWRPRLRAIS